MMQLLVQNKSFRFLMSGSFLSGIGDAMMSVGILLAVYQKTRSPVAISLITLVQVLPYFLVSLYSGVKVDRLDPVKTMIRSDLLRFFLLLILVWLWDQDGVGLAAIYLVVFLIFSVATFFDPCHLVLMKRLVKPEELLEANSAKQMTLNLSKVVGSLLGGVLTGTVDVRIIFLLNGFSYLCSLVCLWLVESPYGRRKVGKNKPDIKRELKQAWIYLTREASGVLRESMAYMVIVNIPVSMISIQMTMLSQRFSPLHPGTYLGWMNSLYLAGTIAGSILIRQVTKRLQLDFDKVPFLIFVYSIMLFLPTVFHHSLFVLILFFLNGFLAVFIQILINTGYQREVSEEYLGRITSFRSLILRLPPPIFSAVYGFSDQYAGLRWGTFFLCTFSAVTVFSVCFHWRERREHRFIKGKKNENVQ
jgi:MFS transporter, DHA3 family, macrolide efflux protein